MNTSFQPHKFHTYKKTLFRILNGLVAIIVIFYIYKKLSTFHFNFSGVFTSAKQLIIAFTVIVLMLINWSVEAIKWRFLLQKIQKLPFLKALKAVFAGITYGMLTPARSGEIIGRPLYLQKQNQIKGVFATSTGSFSQLVITLIAGFLGCLFFAVYHPEKIFLHTQSAMYLVIICAILGIAFCLMAYLKVKFVAKIIRKFKRFHRLHKHAIILDNYTSIELFKALLFSLLRYIIFTTQFYLLIILFGGNYGFVETIAGISVSYFVATAIPVATLAEIGIRTSAALYFIGNGTDSDFGIATATALVWVVNVATPAILGAVIWLLPQTK